MKMVGYGESPFQKGDLVNHIRRARRYGGFSWQEVQEKVLRTGIFLRWQCIDGRSLNDCYAQIAFGDEKEIIKAEFLEKIE